MMNNRIDLTESSEEEDDFGLYNDIEAVKVLRQANIQARLNAKAETEVNLAQVSSPSPASTAPASASAPASAKAEIDANITQVISPSSTFGTEALGVPSSTIEKLDYMIHFLRDIAYQTYQMEWQTQIMRQDMQHSYITEEQAPGDGGVGLGESNTSTSWEERRWQTDTWYSYSTDEQVPGDGGAGLGESNTSMAISLEEGGTNDLVHGDVTTEGEPIPYFEKARRRKEFFVGLAAAKNQVNYQ